MKYTLKEILNNKNIVIKFKTYEECVEISRSLHKMGQRWCSGESYLDAIRFPAAYRLSVGCHCPIEYYETNFEEVTDRAFEILPYSSVRHLFVGLKLHMKEIDI